MKAKGQSCGAALTAKSVEVGAAGSEGRSRLDHQRLTSAGKSAEMRIDAVLDRADAANAAAMGVDVTQAGSCRRIGDGGAGRQQKNSRDRSSRQLRFFHPSSSIILAQLAHLAFAANCIRSMTCQRIAMR